MSLDRRVVGGIAAAVVVVGGAIVLLSMRGPDEAEASLWGEGAYTCEEPPVLPAADGDAIDLTSAARALSGTPDGMQRGVEDMDEGALSIAHGEVRARGGDPLACARVSVVGRPEWGAAFTAADGQWYMAVEGGADITLHFEKTGYLPAQRVVAATVREYAFVDPVILVPPGVIVGHVSLDGSSDFALVRAGESTDPDGARKSFLAVPKDAKATIVYPDGRREPITEMDLRFTEFTVGEEGMSSMPGGLPSNVAYTYAAQYSVEQLADKPGAYVELDKPAYNYVDNFLGFRPGMSVPTATYWYAPSSSSIIPDWVAGMNGMVMKLCGVAPDGGGWMPTGFREDGTVIPRDEFEQMLKASMEEQTVLRTMKPEAGKVGKCEFGGANGGADEGAFEEDMLKDLPEEPGGDPKDRGGADDEFWRIPVETLGLPWDHNWPYGPPPGTKPPNPPPPPRPPPKKAPPAADPCTVPAQSRIECEAQVLTERIVLAEGTTLHYRSDRASGYSADDFLELSVAPPELSTEGLKEIRLDLDVAGRHIRKVFSPTPNQTFSLDWDGQDAFGRPLLEMVPIAVKISYPYAAVYREPADTDVSFGRPGGNAVVTASRASNEVEFSYEWRGTVGRYDAREIGLGGWTLGGHHFYDVRSGMVHTGEGRSYEMPPLPRASNATTISIQPPPKPEVARETGETPCKQFPPLPAVNTSVFPEALVVGPDGDVLVSEWSSFLLRRLTPEGSLERLGGNPRGYSVGGVEYGVCATDRPLSARDVEAAPNGEILLLETDEDNAQSVSALRADGRIDKLFQGRNSTNHYSPSASDGALAAGSHLGWITRIEVAPDGAIYFATKESEWGSHRIRKLDPTGTLSTIAGRTGTQPVGPSGDGGPAIEAEFPAISDIALASDGSIYLTDNGYVRRILTNGTVVAVTRLSRAGYSGEGGLAANATLEGPGSLDVGPDGSVYVADGWQVRRILPNGTIITFAGLPPLRGNTYAGDGGPALHARFNRITCLAAAPGGRLYLCDQYRVRKIDAQGIVTTVAGDGEYPSYEPSPDDEPTERKVEVSTSAPSEVNAYLLTRAPQGGLLAVDPAGWILRVDLDGRSAVVAGGGSLAPDGVPAAHARIGQPESVTTAQDGTIYFAESEGDIYKIDPAGIIRRFATMVRDQERGITWRFEHVAAGPDGALYTLSEYPPTVRRFAPDGTMTKLVTLKNWTTSARGLGVSSSGEVYVVDEEGIVGIVNGVPARVAKLMPIAFDVADDGTLHVVDRSGGIWRVDPFKAIVVKIADVGEGDPAFWISGIVATRDGAVWLARGDENLTRLGGPPTYLGVPGIADIVLGVDGTVLYGFDWHGRHLATFDATTGVVLATFVHDDLGLLVQARDASGRTTRIERDAKGTPTAIVSPDGGRSLLELDANGYLRKATGTSGSVTTLTHDERGFLRSIERPGGARAEFSYDAKGRLVEDRGKDGVVTLIRKEFRDGFEVGIAFSDGRVASARVESLGGGASKYTRTNPDGTTTTTLALASGETRTRFKDGSTLITNTTPDPRWGELVPSITEENYTTPSGQSTIVEYEREVRLRGSDPLALVETTLNVSVGGVTSRAVYRAADRTFTFTSPGGRITTATHDADGRTLTVADPGRAPVTYSATPTGGRVTQGDRTTTWNYDVTTRNATVTRADGTTIAMAFDPAGRLLRTADPGGGALAIAYTADTTSLGLEEQRPYVFRDQGDTQTQTSPGGATTTTTLGPGGRIDSQTGPDGIATTVTYDRMGRPTSLTAGAETLRFEYTPEGDLKGASSPQVRLAIAREDDGNSEAWTGAVVGRVETSAVQQDRYRLTVNGASPIEHALDKDGLLERAGDLQLVRGRASGDLSATTLGAIETSLTRNAYGETLERAATSRGATLYREILTRDAMGRIASRTETVQGAPTAWTYAYDEGGRLVRATRDGQAASYEYDVSGNRASVDGVRATFDSDDRMLSQGDATFTYAPSGALATATRGGATTSYAYDAWGDLREVSLPDGKKVTYARDALGRLVARFLNGTRASGYLWDANTLVATLDANNVVTARFVYAEGIAPSYMVKEGRTYRFVTDAGGSVRLVIDAQTGELAQQLAYDPWGVVTLDTNPGFQPFGFAGGFTDPDSKLVRFGARDYDPATGRWTTRDPRGIAAGLNAYAYARNDPVNLVDPTGLQAEPLSYAENRARMNRPTRGQRLVQWVKEKTIDKVKGWFWKKAACVGPLCAVQDQPGRFEVGEEAGIEVGEPGEDASMELKLKAQCDFGVTQTGDPRDEIVDLNAEISVKARAGAIEAEKKLVSVHVGVKVRDGVMERTFLSNVQRANQISEK